MMSVTEDVLYKLEEDITLMTTLQNKTLSFVSKQNNGVLYHA